MEPTPTVDPSQQAGPSSAPYVQPGDTLETFLPSFWSRQISTAENETPDFKHPSLPLARIKKVMKSDPDVKMISADAPLLFAKACEIFIEEITARAWIVAEASKRRTLSRADIARAISRSDQFDFLIDIIPREDPAGAAAASTNGGTREKKNGKSNNGKQKAVDPPLDPTVLDPTLSPHNQDPSHHEPPPIASEAQQQSQPQHHQQYYQTRYEPTHTSTDGQPNPGDILQQMQMQTYLNGQNGPPGQIYIPPHGSSS